MGGLPRGAVGVGRWYVAEKMASASQEFLARRAVVIEIERRQQGRLRRGDEGAQLDKTDGPCPVVGRPVAQQPVVQANKRLRLIGEAAGRRSGSPPRHVGDDRSFQTLFRGVACQAAGILALQLFTRRAAERPARVATLLTVIDDFDIGGTLRGPDEADAPLIVDADRGGYRSGGDLVVLGIVNGVEDLSAADARRRIGHEPGYGRNSQFCSELAEREGFEPSVPRKGDNGFRDRPDRPLRHLSLERAKALASRAGERKWTLTIQGGAN